MSDQAIRKYRVGIVGGAGYTAGELIRILLNHPAVELAWVHSGSHAGEPLSSAHSGLRGETDITFADSVDLDSVDVLFLCQGHGASRKFWEEHTLPSHLRVIDLAQDYRDESDGYVYGLPEAKLHTDMAARRLVANPGCFATAIQLALLPLAASGHLTGEVHITGVTGSTGAGVKPGATTHFSWRTDNLSVYKPFTHQHLLEIRQTLSQLSGKEAPELTFVPVRGDFARGIFVTATLRTSLTPEEARKLYADFYADAPFTHVAPSGTEVNLKEVVNTNKALVGLTHDGAGRLLVVCAIDNLLKGASGQAVQNMNLLLGLPEDTGLRLKASAF